MTTKKRQVFYSFHYEEDVWRTSQVRNIGFVEGNRPVTDNDWEQVKRGGDTAIKRWINNQMEYRSCTIVLVGEKTADRKWINYEIKESWRQGMGVVGIYIHGLKNRFGETAPKGKNPFEVIRANTRPLTGKLIPLSSIVRCLLPKGRDSKERYDWITARLARIVEASILIRKHYKDIVIR